MDQIFEDREDAPFKIGDLVKRVKSAHGGLRKEESSKVVGFKLSYGKCYRVILEIDTVYGHDPKNLELVKPKEEIINTYQIY
jgi:hypothetical protein